MYIKFIKDHPNGAKGMKKGCVREVIKSTGDKFIDEGIAEESSAVDYEKFTKEYYKKNTKPSRPGGYLTKKTKRTLSEADLKKKNNMIIQNSVFQMNKTAIAARGAVETEEGILENYKLDVTRVVKREGKEGKEEKAKLKIQESKVKDFKTKSTSIDKKLKGMISDIKDKDLKQSIEARINPPKAKKEEPKEDSDNEE